MARRDYVPSRSRMLWTVFCLILLSLGSLGSAYGSTYTVTNTRDDGSTGSLRWAIMQANADANPPSTINFQSGLTGTITLTSALPAITANVTITGPGEGSLTVSGNNSATVGTIFTIETGVTASISGLNIENGNSGAGNGGGILNNGTLTVISCTISNNSGGEGGGIRNNGTLTLMSSTVSGNTTAGFGGGIGNDSTLTVVNSTFSGNSAPGNDGGAISNTGTLTVTNSTFSANSAYIGGGIDNASTLTMTNSIVAGNTAPLGDGDINQEGTYTDGGGNVVSPTNPINLAPLGNYGGTTQTMLPLPGSPAICVGNKTGAPTTDQRGFTTGAAAYCTSGKIDSGAVQTNYQSIQFTNAGTGYAAAVNSVVAFPAAPIVSVTENGQNIGGIPLSLTFTGAPGS